jgi:hypothetical protein
MCSIYNLCAFIHKFNILFTLITTRATTTTHFIEANEMCTNFLLVLKPLLG